MARQVHLGQRLFDLFIFSSFFIALCAVGMTYQTALLFRLPHVPHFYGFVFCGTVCSYNLHWGLTPKLFQNPMLPRTGFNAVSTRTHFLLAVVALLGAGFFFLHLLNHWFWLAGAGVLSFLYTAPKLPTHAALLLRRIAYGKTVFLTLAWTYITAILPFLLTDTKITETDIAFCVNRFFLIYAICILFDLRDQAADRTEGIKSMVTELEAPAVARLYAGALLAFFVSAACLLPRFSAMQVAALVAPSIVLAIGYPYFKRRHSIVVYNFVLDGLMVSSLPLLVIIQQ